MMLARSRPHRLAAFSFFTLPPARFTSTTTTSRPTDTPQDSIFTAPESPWDHVFSDIDPNPPPLRASRPRTRPANAAGRKKDHGSNQDQLVQRASGVRHQRASITAREMSVFDEMFDLIFSAVSRKGGKGSTLPSGMGPPSARKASATVPSVVSQTASIGGQDAPLNDLFRTLRRHTSRVRWTTAIDEELDRKKETMELFNTDHELLQWVMMELFGESRQWDEEAKKAIAASGTGKTNTNGEGEDALFAKTDSSADTSATSSVSTSASTPVTSLSSSGSHGDINHSIYPHLIAHAMRIFRTTYSNPSLSLAIFNQAARVSIPSYVFGCTAPVYNELIEAEWEGWGDLEGVCNALEEMRANGVKIDGRTRMVVEKVRREVGAARPVALGEAKQDDGEEQTDADVNPLARRVWGELGEVEVMRVLHRIEQLVLRDRSRKATTSPHEESWKSAVLQAGEDDGWCFDGWEKTQIKLHRRA